jgi:uncharacterized protein YjbI with pentapeptide repeats
MQEQPRKSSSTSRSPSKEAPDDVRRQCDAAASPAAKDLADHGDGASSIAAIQSEYLEKVKGAVVDSADTARNVWILFLTFGAYLAIAAGSVTHRHLLLEEHIRLPLLNVELPLVAFFLTAPVLFLIFHVYLLMHLKLMSDKVRYYNRVVRGLGLDRTTEDQLRLRLPDFMFVQYLAGPDANWKSLMHCLLVALACFTVIIAPVILLLLVQLQFLSYHDGLITWSQRLIIILDLALLWCFWPKILVGSGGSRRFASAIYKSAAIICCGGVFIFSIFIAEYPGEYLHGAPGFASLTEWSFDEGPVDSVNIPRGFTDRLVVPDQSIIDFDALDKIIARQEKEEIEPWESENTLSLRGRDLVDAALLGLDLRRVDLSKVNLQGANLFDADLRGATLNVASLQSGTLDYAKLQGATLHGASLYGASLEGAHLQGADLRDAKLQGANLEGAHLQGANLSNADLRGAFLDEAYLQGANLKDAQLQGASFKDTVLWRVQGLPKIKYPVRIWVVKDLSGQNPTDEDLAKWKKDAVDRVDNAVVKQRISKIFDRPKATEQKERASSDYWINIDNEASRAEYQDYLVYLACAADKDVADKDVSDTPLKIPDTPLEKRIPFVAQGVIRNLFGTTHERLPSSGERRASLRVAKKLLDAAEGRIADCPGMEGLGAASIVRLRAWVEVEDDTRIKLAYRLQAGYFLHDLSCAYRRMRCKIWFRCSLWHPPLWLPTHPYQC